MTNPDEPNAEMPAPQQSPSPKPFPSGGAYSPGADQPPSGGAYSPGADQPPPGSAYPPGAYQPPPGSAYTPAPPVPQGYGYGQPGAVPAGMVFDAGSGLTLPQGTQLASVGRRIGAYFLSVLLSIVTLGIGYLIWGLVVWGRGTSPALQVLGMRVWKPEQNRPASWGTMALRDILGTIVTGILSVITELISFVMFLSGKQRQSLADKVAGTVVIYDPNKVLQ